MPQGDKGDALFLGPSRVRVGARDGRLPELKLGGWVAAVKASLTIIARRCPHS